MRVYRLRSLSDWQKHAERTGARFRRRCAQAAELEGKLRNPTTEPRVRGYSYLAGQEVDFKITIDEGPCNWRETLVCPVTGLNNRVRGALHIFDTDCASYEEDRLYLMEQTTATFEYLNQRFTNLIGSEYLGDDMPPGSIVEAIRHEDATQLSFENDSIDHVLSFDVFEHVPSYLKAFEECHRILRPGGSLLWTVPFDCNSEDNLVRACIQEDGTIGHLLEPIYHGDPIRAEGVLCFYHFGWTMLDEIRQIGFTDAYAAVFWSDSLGYFGPESVVFVARKESSMKDREL